MKTLALLASASLAALVAFVSSTVSLEAAASLCFAAGVVAIALRDYSRSPRSLLAVSALPVAVMPARTERLGLAA